MGELPVYLTTYYHVLWFICRSLQHWPLNCALERSGALTVIHITTCFLKCGFQRNVTSTFISSAMCSWVRGQALKVKKHHELDMFCILCINYGLYPPPSKKNSISNLTNMYNCIIHVHNSLSAGQNPPGVVVPIEEEESSLSPNLPTISVRSCSPSWLQDFYCRITTHHMSAMYLTSHTANYLNFWYFYSHPHFIVLFTVNFNHQLCF